MSDAINTPSDKTTAPQQLSDAQVGNAVATKFLNEVHGALTGTPDSFAPTMAELNAWTDLSGLQGDPQQKVALNAIAGKIESHDPSLGLIQGSVERDKAGDVTGFTFTNPQQEAAYAQSINAYMTQNHTTLDQAIANDGTNGFDAADVRGLLYMPANDNSITLPRQPNPIKP